MTNLSVFTEQFDGKEVRIIEVYESSVLASWNNNKPQKFYLNSIKKWKVNRPEPKREIFGHKSYL